MSSTFVGLRIYEDLLEPFRARAESQERTLRAEIRQAPRGDLEREETPEPKGAA